MKPKAHKKARLPRAVMLESRREIGFGRVPVQDRWTKPVITGLPTRLADTERL